MKDNTNYKKMAMYEFDRHKETKQISSNYTDIQVFDSETGELLFRGANKVIITGSVFTGCKHFKSITPPVILPNYNNVLGLENTLTEQHFDDEEVCLFAIGVGGAGAESSTILDVDYTKWITPEELLPFRYQLDNDDLSVASRSKYFGRKSITDKNRIAYYFKAFDTAPIMKVQRVDGTPIDDTIFTSTNSMDAETFVELRLKITKEDVRDFFFATTGINDAKVNTISLLTAWKKTIDGFDYYQNIRPLTKLNITTELLSDLTKGLDIIYHIYY